MKEFDLHIPLTLGDISLGQYQKYLNLYDKWDKKDEDYIKVKMLQIFCGLSPENIKDIQLSSFDSIVAHLIELIQSDTPLVKRFKLNGYDSDGKFNVVEFGFIPSLDKMSYGEYMDLKTYINDWSNMHKAMAVLFRPTTFSKKNVYKIEKYKGSGKYSENMIDMPVTVAMGAVVFFYRLMNKLPRLTLDYFQKEMKKGTPTSHLKQFLVEDGDSINRFIHYVKGMSQESIKLQVPIYINV